MKKRVLRERRKQEEVEVTEAYEEMSKAELLDIARKLNLKAQSKMSKADIIELINSNKED